MKKTNFRSLDIGEHTISTESSKAIRNLGVFFDNHATMNDHVTKTVQTCFFHLKNVSKIRHLIDEDTARLVIHALVTSRLDYCNSLLLGTSKRNIHRLQKIQNKAARVVTRSTDEIEKVLHNLHWLPVESRIHYKICVIIHKCLHNKAPVYLSELCQKYVPPRALRSAEESFLAVPRTRLSLGKPVSFI